MVGLCCCFDISEPLFSYASVMFSDVIKPECLNKKKYYSFVAIAVLHLSQTLNVVSSHILILFLW